MDTLKFWAGVERFFAVVDQQPAGAMVTVTYYGCDRDGYDITGDNRTHNNTFVQTAARPHSPTRKTRGSRPSRTTSPGFSTTTTHAATSP